MPMGRPSRREIEVAGLSHLRLVGRGGGRSANEALLEGGYYNAVADGDVGGCGSFANY